MYRAASRWFGFKPRLSHTRFAVNKADCGIVSLNILSQIPIPPNVPLVHGTLTGKVMRTPVLSP
jgi:hypothetical protein